ncbi:MAG TPA: FtsX-like permease family protein [Roseivirga sp.]
MNLPYFISKRINSTEKGSFSGTIHKIAIASVALGIAIMMISFMILGGFQNNIKDKIFNFSGHIQIKKFTLTNSYEEAPIVLNEERKALIQNSGQIRHIQEFAHKPGLISLNDEVFGLLYKGMGPSFDTTSFAPYLIEGSFPVLSDTGRFNNEVLISEKNARQMQVGVGDRIVAYFIMDPPRTRSLVVKGIYSSGLEEFDAQIVIGDIKLVRGLNNWEENQVGGYEVFVNDVNNIEEADNELIEYLSIEQYTERMDEKYETIFDWLNLLSQNVYILIGLILFVACFNMISVLFILIMERTSMIGSFKAFGATNQLIRRIFSYNGIRLVLKGLLVGNGIALLFGWLQYTYHLIPLEASTYYMDHVPIDWNWIKFLGLNVLTLVLVGLTLVLPTALISRVSPVKAIRFD